MANNLIKEMKERIAKSGTSKKEVLYFPPDSVKRIRFLEDLEDGSMVQFHSDYENHIYELCKDPEDHENCKLCNEGVPILEQYAWSVWDYDSNAVRILLFKATGISPIPALIELYEEYGTLLDRDIKIKKVGKGVGGSFTVTPLDKSRFRNDKAKPFTEKQRNEIFAKAFGSSPVVVTDEVEEDDDEEEEVKETKKSKKKAKKEPTLRERFEELDEEDLRDICKEIGMSKKEIKALEDSEEILDELFDNYEEADLEELLEDYEEE
jgi:hypothetical protein